MSVLLLAEVTDGELSLDATAKAVTAAAKLGDVTALCCGESAAAAGEAAAKIAGVSKVLVAEDASLGHRLAEPTAALIVSLSGDYSHIVAPATTDAKNVLPRVAALLDVMVISDASGVVDADTFEQQARNTWSNLERDRLNAEFLKNQANIAAEFLELARRERQLGERSLIDVLAGETALINANSDATAVETDVLLNVFRLLNIMGKLEAGVVN